MLRADKLLAIFLPVTLLLSACQPMIQPQSATETTETIFTPTGHVCGAATTIAVQGEHAFLGLSYELVVLNIADPSRPVRESALPISTNDLVAQGDYLYVAGRDGLTIVNVGDPSLPYPVTSVPTAKTATAMAVVPPYTYLVDLNTLYVVYTANPGHAAVVSSLRLGGGLMDLEVDSSNLYIAALDGLHVVDVATPQLLKTIGFFATVHASQELVASNNKVYLADFEFLYNLDLSIPTAPRELARFPLKGVVGRMRWVGDRLYVANGEFGLRVFSIADKTQLVELGAYDRTSLIFDVLVQDGFIYVVNCDEGLRIFAAQPNGDLAQVGVFESLGIVTDIAVYDNYVYALSGWDNMLHLLPVDELAQAQQHVDYVFPYYVLDFTVANDKAYVLTIRGLHIVDIGAPIAPVPLAYIGMLGESVAVVEHHAYISNMEGDLTVVELAGPTPTVVQIYQKMGTAGSIQAAGGLIYLIDPQGHVRILAIASTGQLTQLGAITLRRPAVRIALAGHYALIVAGFAGVYVADISEPSSPVVVGAFDTVGYARDAVVENDYLYVADEKEGVVLFDIADPANLVKLSAQSVPGGAFRLAVHDGTVYVAGGLGGITSLRRELPSR